MDGLSSGLGTQQSSGYFAPLHTARKRSKASLATLPGASSIDSQATFAEATTGPANNSSSSGAAVTYAVPSASRSAAPDPANSSNSSGGGGHTIMLPTSTAAAESRGGRAAGWLQGSKSGNGWQIGGYALDYVLDWAVVLVLGVILAASEAGVPRESYMFKADLDDTAYPLLPNSVPAWSVPLYSLVLPAVLFGLHSAVLRRPLLEGHHLVLGVLTSVLFTAALTNIIKCPVGRLRPDFNARCWPDGKVAWSRDDDLGGYPLCSGPAGSVAEGRKSFPSGHSSWSAAGLCYISWWLLDRLRVFGGSGHVWRLVAAVLPALAAVAVGISRYIDYWHWPSDIAVGLLLGAGVSWVCYRQQRSRLAELDPITYGSNGSSNGGLPAAGGWAAAGAGDRGSEAGDGTPLLYSGPHRPFGLQQQQAQGGVQSLPV